MRRHETTVWLILCSFLFFGSANLLHATTYNVPYTLAASGQVSMNIYDSNGHIVRELLHAMPRSIGANTEIWDGLDSNGNSVPAGTYSWKLLYTPSGLTAKFLTNVGGNYSLPAEPHSTFADKPPGNHSGVRGVALDSSGVYLISTTAESVPGMIKQSADGNTRLWTVDLNGGTICTGYNEGSDGTNLYSLYGQLTKRLCADGSFVAAWPESFNGSLPTRVAVNGSNIVLMYPDQNEITWIDSTTGAVIDSASLPGSPQGMTVDASGKIYLTIGASIYTLTRANHTPTALTLSQVLISPTVIDVDTSNGDILVFCAGTQQQVYRYASTGTFKQSYGAVGGRVDGLYVPTSYLNITDLRADGAGGYYIAEPDSAPVRVSHFDVNGNIIKEWYGGQAWEPWICPEPTDPEWVWVKSAQGYAMRCHVDYTTNTWTVHSTYKTDGEFNGLLNADQDGQIWAVYQHNGTTYLAKSMDASDMPCLFKVVQGTNWSLQPVSMGNTYVYPGEPEPSWLTSWAAAAGVNTGAVYSYVWTDAPDAMHPTGDGFPEQSEFTFSNVWNGGSASVFDDNLNVFLWGSLSGYTNQPVVSMPVTSWNTAGYPQYGSFPGTTPFSYFPATRVPKGAGPYIYPDVATGDLFSAVDAQMPIWGLPGDAYMIKWNPDGSEAWEAGQAGGDHLGHPRGVIGGLRSIVGTTHGCVAAMDFEGDGSGYIQNWLANGLPTSYVWDQDGLFVGGMFDSADLTNARWENYRLGSDDLCGRFYTDPTSGDVKFFGIGENQGYIFDITGWNNWVRQNGNVTVTTPSTTGTGQGLRGEYYSSSNFTNLVTTQVDAAVNFAWGNTAPPGLPSGHNYSVRWTGTVTPTYGPTYFQMFAGGSANNFDSTEYNDSQTLGAAGPYCQFGFHGTSVKWMGTTYPNGAAANVYLDGVLQSTQANFYSATTTYQTAIPGGTFTGLANGDHTIRIANTGTLGDPVNGSGRPEINVDYWIMDGGVTVDDAGEPYTFYVNAADGARLWIDDQLLVNDPTDKSLPVEHSEQLVFQGGTHTVRLDYYDDADPSAVTLSWSSTQQTKAAIASSQLYPTKDFVLPRDANNTVPGTIECENFDEGGQGVGYYYPVTILNPISYRGLNELVSIQPINFIGVPSVSYKQDGNYQISLMPGEWTKYTVNVAQTGAYTIGVNASTAQDDPTNPQYGGTFHFEVDGAMVGTELTIPLCTPATPWAFLSVPGVNLTAGQHAIKLVSDTEGGPNYPSGWMGVFDNIQILPAAAAPSFAPAPGAYTSPATVTISSTTPGASFAYTTDGSTPTEYGGIVTHGTLSTGPVSLTATSTLTAITFASGYADSSATSGSYTLTAALPTFSPVGGSYTSPTVVTVSTATTGASIAYTTDGTTPTVSGGTITHGTLYTTGLSLTATTTLKAIAFESGITNSVVATAAYTIKVATPTFSPVAGTYTTSTSETISSTTPGASIAYTTDGTSPTESGGTVTHGTLYTSALNINATTTIKALAFKVGITDSAVASGTFTIKAATPTFSPAAGTFTTSTSETITSTTPGVSFAFTTDGTTPTESGGTVTHGTLYTAAVNITATTTLKAIAFKVGITDSAVASGTFTIKAAAPTFGTAAGTYIAATTTLATATPGASIAYTTDGTTPTESGGTVTHGTLYSSAITLANGTSTVKAIAFKVGLTDSAVSSAAYTVYFTQDIGTVGVAGSASLSSGTFTVAGAGAGITGTADAFRMVYLPMSGNCTVTAHVASFTSTNALAMAGVMIRQGLTSTSVYAACLFKPQGTVQSLLSYRTGTGTSTTAASVTSPYWVRIKRATNTLTAYQSTNGTTWTQIGSGTTVSMTGTVYAGLAVTSGTTANTTTATFDNVTVTSP